MDDGRVRWGDGSSVGEVGGEKEVLWLARENGAGEN